MLGHGALSQLPLSGTTSAGGGSVAYSLSGAAGAYTLTGQTATVTRNVKLAGAVGTYTLTGQAATLTRSVKLSGAGGAVVTWNASDKDSTVTLSNSDTTASKAAASWAAVRATLGRSSGKWYFEIRHDAGAQNNVGVAPTTATLGSAGYWSVGQGGYTYNAANGQKIFNGASAAYGSSWNTVGKVVGVAVDLDNGKIWWSVDNVWQASGDPAAGTNPAYTGLTGSLYPIAGVYSSTQTARFKSTDQTYSAPTGFTAWSDTSGSYTLTGRTATLARAVKLSGSVGSYSLTGQAATVKRGYSLSGAVGSYTLIGQAATLAYSAGHVAYALSGAVGSYNLLGQGATLKVAHALNGSPGIYALTGGAAVLSYSGSSPVVEPIGSAWSPAPDRHPPRRRPRDEDAAILLAILH